MDAQPRPGPRPGTRQPAASQALGRSGPMAGGLVAVVLWGLAPVATRAAVAHLAPMPLLVLRLTVAALVLLPWAVPVFRRLRLRSLGRLVAAGALGLIGYNLSVTVGLQWLPAATAGLLLATEPVWVMILGKVFLAERAGARAWLGSAAALGGVAVLAGPAALAGAGGPRALAGAGLVLAGTLAFGAYTIVLRPLSQAYGAVPATAASTVVGRHPLPGLRRDAVRADTGAPVRADLGRGGLPRARQHGGRDAAVEPGCAIRRHHPRQPAALPRACGQRGRRGRPPRRAPDPDRGRRRGAHPGRSSGQLHCPSAPGTRPPPAARRHCPRPSCPGLPRAPPCPLPARRRCATWRSLTAFNATAKRRPPAARGAPPVKPNACR